MYYDGVAQSVNGSSNTANYVFNSGAAICVGSQNGGNILGNCNVAEFVFTANSGARLLRQNEAFIAFPFELYSESTIKQEGDYSMKIVAPQTTSLNKTITRTVSPTINLTDQDTIKLQVRASRTGTNFKIGFHDSGGTLIESNIAITEANKFEKKEIDISAVPNANKDGIDQITKTITNADAENEIYFDNMMAYVQGEGAGGGSIFGSSIIIPGGV